MTRARRARAEETIAKVVMGSATAAIVGVAAFFLGYLVYRGAGSLSLGFLTQMPADRMTAGGIYPVIVGTLYLIGGTAMFAVPVGVAAGVYLAEYAARNRRTRIIRLAIANMAGVPSIVYGLFGLSLFVIQLKMGVSLLAGSLTLASMTLPIIITTTEEALRQIPSDLRHASLALGATRLRTIVRVVLPAAVPNIVTGSILGLSRAAGETAPILFTAVAFFAPLPRSVSDQVMALPYHIFIMATQPARPAPHIVWGSALVLVGIVTIVNVAAAGWRSVRRKRARS